MPQSLWELDRFEAEAMELMHLRREQYKRKQAYKIQLIKRKNLCINILGSDMYGSADLHGLQVGGII